MNLLDEIQKKRGIRPDALAVSYMSEIKVKAAERDQPAILTATATTPRVDLEEEVVVSTGLSPVTFNKLGAIYYNHSYTYDPLALPVASLRNTKSLGKDGWRAQWSMARHQFAQDVATAIEDGAIRATSIGYRRLIYGEPTREEIATYGKHSLITREADWIELSITPMPCQPDAMIDGFRSMALRDDVADALDSLAVKGRIARESAYAMGLPRPRVLLQVKRVLDLGGGA